MTMLDVLSLVVACVAIAFGVVTAVRARSAGEIAAIAREAANRADEQAQAARADAAMATEQAREARADAASALDQATRALAEAARSRAAVAAAEASAAEAAHTLESASRALAGSDGSGLAHGAESSTPAVRWELEQVKGVVWLLKNVGDGTAESALLSDATLPPKYIRPDEVIPRVVASGDHLQFRVTVPRGGPPPRVRVTWRESGGEPQSKDMTLLLDA